DNRISNYEFQSYSAAAPASRPSGRFTALDTNRDGVITWNEWRGTEGDYVKLDTNGDARLSPSEFESNPTPANRFAALDADREDRANNHGWDLDGQTELERADSGYSSQLGTLSDYQSGYRDGFRIGYREGYGPR